mmetsp:Transcript_12717/g.39165  ORF Transcript_12717/g.39165 Transcript_12717/m.39165 type:complete len:315 (+) Transcript_12717:1127-2071(+)
MSGARPMPGGTSSPPQFVGMTPMTAPFSSMSSQSPIVLPMTPPQNRCALRRLNEKPSASNNIMSTCARPSCAAHAKMSEFMKSDRSIGRISRRPPSSQNVAEAMCLQGLASWMTMFRVGESLADVNKTWRSAKIVRRVAPFWILPPDASRSSSSRSVIMMRMLSAVSAETRIKSCVDVESPTRTIKSRPMTISSSSMPRDARPSASFSFISAFSFVLVMTTTGATATDVEGGWIPMPRYFCLKLELHCVCARRMCAICATSRGVASFVPSTSVCPAVTTFVLPSLSDSMNVVTPSVMKPTKMAKTTRPDNSPRK